MNQEFMPHWKKHDQCFEEEQIEVIVSSADAQALTLSSTKLRSFPVRASTSTIPIGPFPWIPTMQL